MGRNQGTLFVFFSAILYSLGGICIKLIPWNGMSINSARTGIALIIIGGYFIATKHRPKMNRWILFGAICVFLTNALFALANKMTTAANVIVLQFTAPIFVIVLCAIFYRQKPRRHDVIACLVVFGGIMFFFLDSLSAGGGMGNLLALISGVTYAGVFMMKEFPNSDAISSAFFGHVISALVGLPMLVQETVFSPTIIASVLVLGIFQVGVAYILLCLGLKTVSAVTASLVSGIEPILNPILVAVFYHEKMGKYALIGAVIVIAGVLWYNIVSARMNKDIDTENSNPKKDNICK